MSYEYVTKFTSPNHTRGRGDFFYPDWEDTTMSDKFHDATQPLEKVKTQDKRDAPDTSAPVEVDYSDHA